MLCILFFFSLPSRSLTDPHFPSLSLESFFFFSLLLLPLLLPLLLLLLLLPLLLLLLTCVVGAKGIDADNRFLALASSFCLPRDKICIRHALRPSFKLRGECSNDAKELSQRETPSTCASTSVSARCLPDVWIVRLLGMNDDNLLPLFAESATNDNKCLQQHAHHAKARR